MTDSKENKEEKGFNHRVRGGLLYCQVFPSLSLLCVYTYTHLHMLESISVSASKLKETHVSRKYPAGKQCVCFSVCICLEACM